MVKVNLGASTREGGRVHASNRTCGGGSVSEDMPEPVVWERMDDDAIAGSEASDC